MNDNNLIVLSIATDPDNSYVSEFVQTLVKLNYRYELLGQYKKWEGFTTKMKYFMQALKELPKNQLVIVCDSYDILFVQKPDYMIKQYKALANDKIVSGLENITDMFCKLSTICDPKLIDTCKIKNPTFPDFKYPNAGFLMGHPDQLMKVYQFMLQNHYKDDQYSLFQYIIQHCDEFYFDYKLDFVFNYFAPAFVRKSVKVTLKDNLVIVNSIAKPGCVHIPGHYLDFGKRSEMIRNYLVPSRKRINSSDYAYEFYKKFCKPEFSFFGYWWWFIILLLIILIIYLLRKRSSSST